MPTTDPNTDSPLMYTKSDGTQLDPADMDPVYILRAYNKAVANGDQDNIDALTPYI